MRLLSRDAVKKETQKVCTFMRKQTMITAFYFDLYDFIFYLINRLH